MSWLIDPYHAQVSFSARHMMLMKVHGRFEKFSGSVEFNEQDPAQSSVDVQIEAASINTNEPQRDGHLKSPDFLDVEQYPHLFFKSKRAEKVSDTHGRIIGDLTIRGVSKEVVLDVEYLGKAKSPYGNINAGFSASTKINRKDWGLTWNVALETGGVLVGEEVTITIEVEIVQQPDAVEESATQSAAVAA